MDKIIEKLEYFNKSFPHEELKEAMKRKEEITPILLEKLDRIIECPEIVTEDQDYMLHLYALYLLAQFKEKRAFTKIIDLISFSPEEVDLFLGDTLTEGLSSILYSTYNGELSILQSVIENPLINIYARGAALDVYSKLYSDGAFNKDELIDYLRELIYDNSYDEDEDLATDVQDVVVDNHIFEMIDDIQFLYDENRIDEFITGKYDDFIDEIFSYRERRKHLRCINDVVEEMYWWACFEQPEEEKRKKDAQLKKLKKEISKMKKQNLKKSKNKKVGRNDPCPCGSGRKYKQCCIDKASNIKEEFVIETAEEREKWMKDYPIEQGEKQNDKVLITDIYDKESIDIDKLVYLALHRRAIPIWVHRDILAENRNKIIYLTEASEKFISKCEMEGISSFEEYDKKYKIHYRSEEWLKELRRLIEENDLEEKYSDILSKIEEVIVKFS